MNRVSSWAHNFSIERDFDPNKFPDTTHFRGEVYRVQVPSPPGMRVSDTTMSSSSFDARNVAADTINTNTNVQKHPISHGPVKYETTTNGDVVVVEPSFDADDNDGRIPSTEKNPTRNASSAPKRGHTRNLSEIFYDATTLSNDRNEEPSGSSRAYGIRGPPPTTSPAVGKKHRRVFSGDVSNPPEAHRRINSIGNSASIKRSSFRQQRQHQRVDSAGLDILTAAADVSREELASAAGERVRGGRNPWDPPSASSNRRSPVELVSYDHSAVAHPPPPPPSRNHHRPYPPAPPPPGYYGGPLSYPQPPYPPPFYTNPPSSHGYQRSIPPTPTSSYPVQYARGPDPYMKHPAPLQQPSLERPTHDRSGRKSSPAAGYGDDKNPSEKTAGHGNSAMTPPPPVPPSHWRGGTTQGVQTFVTAIGVGEGGRTIHPTASHRHAGTNTDTSEPPLPEGHHRKTSSLSSWVPMSVFMGPPGETAEHPLKGHHRSTSSTVSFLQGFDVGMDTSDTAFLQNLLSSGGTPAPAFSSNQQVSIEAKRPAHTPSSSPESHDEDGTSKLASGGTSKRVRRKCTVANCGNRVVQGGLCISHGAKRKQCKHAGCNKNVKKAGLCSTHGPCRKRCDVDNCGKVAVQGGRCIAHGAKKKLCSVDACTKQAILSGMCKKHHDQTRNSSNFVAPPPGESFTECKVIENGADQSNTDTQPIPGPAKPSKSVRKPTHTRGLSIFQEISAADVGTLLLPEEAEAMEESQPPRDPGHRHHSTFSREFGMY